MKYLFTILLALLGFLVPAIAQPEKYTLKVRPILPTCSPLVDNPDATISKLAEVLSKAPSEDKIRIARTLGDSCNKNATAHLLDLIADKDPEVRIAAVEALGKLGDPEAVEPLNNLSADPDWRVRFVTGSELCRFSKYRASYGALNYFASSMVDADNPSEGAMLARLQTVLTVNQLLDSSYSRKTLRFMYAYLDLKDPKYRKMAEDTMRLLKDSKNFSIEMVGEMKQALNPNFRKVSAYWLGELQIERGRDVLANAAANDPDPEVKRIAAEALKKLPPEENAETPTEKPAPAVKPAAKKPLVRKKSGK